MMVEWSLFIVFLLFTRFLFLKFLDLNFSYCYILVLWLEVCLPNLSWCFVHIYKLFILYYLYIYCNMHFVAMLCSLNYFHFRYVIEMFICTVVDNIKYHIFRYANYVKKYSHIHFGGRKIDYREKLFSRLYSLCPIYDGNDFLLC